MSTSHSSYPPSEVRGWRDEGRREIFIRPPSFGRVDLAGGLALMAEYRDLLYTLSLHRIRVRYKQTVLGVSWAILQPFAIMLLFTLLFRLIVEMPSEGTPYAVFVYAGLLPWTYFSAALSNGAGGLVSNSQLITKVYFPREILPLTYVIAALFDFCIASSVLAVLLFWYKVPLTLNAFYALPIIAVLTVFASAMSLLLSALQVRLRDVGVAMPLLLQVWLLATPVAYPLGAVPERLRSIYLLNPLAALVESFRGAILHGAAPDLRAVGVASLISLILLAASYLYFRRIEANMADII